MINEYFYFKYEPTVMNKRRNKFKKLPYKYAIAKRKPGAKDYKIVGYCLTLEGAEKKVRMLEGLN